MSLMFQCPGVGVGAFSIGAWITVGRSEANASRSAGPRSPADSIMTPRAPNERAIAA